MDSPPTDNPTLLDHFRNPRNVGKLDDADGVGTATAGGCGDVMRIWIRVRDEHIRDIRYKCKGCSAAIACGSVTTELAAEKDLDAAGEITDETIEQAVGGLAPDKRHCSNLGAEALQNAIMDYVTRSVDGELRQ
ncbi:MAG: iron-sulfur cluster assembly scaffold protein [Phycisphaerae bacterium]|nr:iron-sulfur cluster assembly scaffold protein [Phycisphaerae bacterium]